VSQTPGEWPPQDGGYSQGGYPPPGQPGAYPPQAQPGGYATQPQPGGGFPPQPPSGYPPQGQPGSYSGQPGAYPPQGGYNPQGGYLPSGAYPGAPPGYPPGGGPGGPPPVGPPPKKSRAMIIGIVAAAVVMLAAIGGIVLVLTQGSDTQPDATITPGTPSAEPTAASPSAQPSSAGPSGKSTGPLQPTQPTEAPNPVPSGKAITLDHGISLTPADGYELEKSGTGYARVSNGDQLFLGQAIAVDPGTNPGQLCDTWHHKIAEGQANGQFGNPETADLNSRNLKGATCTGSFTASNGSGSQDVVVFSLVSVRSDGVTAIGTMYFSKGADGQQLNADFSTMMNSMLQDQAAGG
jgi:hypothetical protein